MCEDFGLRKQYSVFLCRLSATDFVRLRSRLYDLLKLEEDQVLFIPLCAKCVNAIEALGPADGGARREGRGGGDLICSHGVSSRTDFKSVPRPERYTKVESALEEEVIPGYLHVVLLLVRGSRSDDELRGGEVVPSGTGTSAG